MQNRKVPIKSVATQAMVNVSYSYKREVRIQQGIDIKVFKIQQNPLT